MVARVFKNTVFQIISRSLVVAVSLLTTAFLTRFFGAGGYGEYVFVTSFVLLFVGLSDLGLTLIGVREAAIDKAKAESLFHQIFGLRLLLSTFLFSLFNLLILFLPQFTNLKWPGLIASLVIPFLVLRTTTEAILQTYLRLDLSSSLEILAAIFFLGALFCCFFFPNLISLPYLMLVWVLSALVSGLSGLFLSAKYLKPGISFSLKKVSPLLKAAFPLGIYLLVYSIYDRGIDSFILKTFIGSRAVGFYGLAYKIHGNLILGAAFLMNSLFPLMASQKENPALIKKTFEKAFTVLILVGFFLGLSFFISAPVVIKAVAGPDFGPSILALRILLIATFFSYLNHLTGYVMIILSEQKQLLKFSLVALFFNLILNLIFIPFFSFPAAAVITVLTEVILWFLTQRFLVKKYRLKYNQVILVENLKEMFLNKEKYFEEN